MRLALAHGPIEGMAYGRRLNAADGAPVAVAFSGGGDSLALLLSAAHWARQACRRLIVLTVDHRLQPESAGWARSAAVRAARLGLDHRTLRWEGGKPATGLPAAARVARHALMADAARAAGARVILMGHTADDLLEAEVMRASGSNVRTPAEWSPSPAWPQGRGVFLFRPMLRRRRADLRAWLASLGETWIDDPANEDPRFARSLARRWLVEKGELRLPPTLQGSGRHPCLGDVAQGAGGDLVLPRAALAGLSAGEVRRLLSALCLCAAGGVRPPRREAVDRLRLRLETPGVFAATLAGARIEGGAERVRFCREPGEFQRAGQASAALSVGESVFDGRFALTSAEAGWRVRPVRGLAKRLAPAERARLAALPSAVRAGLPAIEKQDRAPSCPGLAQGGPVRTVSLVAERLFAALGGMADEASMWRVAKPRPGS